MNSYSTPDPVKERVLQLSFGEAVKHCSVVGVGSTAWVIYMLKEKPWFRKSTNVSSRVAIPTMATMFMFALSFELTQISAQRNPERWGLVAAEDKKTTRIVIPFHHTVLNAIYDNPFSCIAGLGAPVAGYILHSQLKLPHLTLSQRVMHSRVFAQMSVLSLGLGTLAFREYMDKRGRFPDEAFDASKFVPASARTK